MFEKLKMWWMSTPMASSIVEYALVVLFAVVSAIALIVA
jgi:hypothetical protein